ncbi:hypothetical protein LWI29_016333 [Acer saccharum]|uniref:Retrotransposon Copia-like N-terminal domain-containing protein n=1 Tax=Acer saccharum TaxID=4024 RepID=A0AA39RD70_ACESA|nr:hypothetical protein LWI29_016333 [Acer saccharum]
MQSFSASVGVVVPNLAHIVSIKLDRNESNDYVLWLAQFLPVLRSQNLISFVDGTKPCPAKFKVDSFGKDTTEIDPVYSEWQQKDQLILSWINASLTPSVLSTVALLSTSHAVWKSLEKRYASQSKTRILQLKNQLHNTKRGDLSIYNFIDKITNIADNLALVGKPVDDDDLITIIMNNVGLAWLHMR